METIAIALSLISIASALIAIWLSYRAEIKLRSYIELKAHREANKPHEKKILVPGKGIFTQPKLKRSPKYWRDDELWAKEQEDKRS